MKILHTSDWHLGRVLYGRKRYEEFEGFLAWLAETICNEEIDVLLIAGDVFDTSTPSNRAQELYYRFLCRIAKSPCRHVIVIAGNHDSPTFLDAPKELLHALDVHVIGSMPENYEDEVLVLHDQHAIPELIVCAVPYLRDRDIRIANVGESIDDKGRKLVEGIKLHYAEVCSIAEQKRKQLAMQYPQQKEVPIVAMGHLFTAGGKTIEGDGVRELYVGSLAHLSSSIFPPCIDYLALGHLHVPQCINQSETLRYSGSPLAMGFGEANQEKSVCLVEFTGLIAAVSQITVPVFQQLKRLRGNRETLLAEIMVLVETNSNIWLEIIYDGEEIISDLRECVEAAILGTELHILRIKNNRIIERVLNQRQEDETLDDLNVTDVFVRCLSVHDISEEQRKDLLYTYQEAISLLNEIDALAE